MKPYVKNQKTGEVLPAETRVLRPQERGDLADLLAAVERLSPEMAAGRAAELIQHGTVIGVFACGELCAFCGLLRPGKDDLAESLGMGERSAAMCGSIDGLGEHGDYRENGLEREVVLETIKLAWREGLDFVAVAVPPGNRERLLSLMSINGMRLKAQARRRGCHLYYILCCARQDRRLYTDYRRFSLEDTYNITRSMADGYDGIATFRAKDADYIWMAR